MNAPMPTRVERPTGHRALPEINLPRLIEARDYHEFAEIQRILRLVIPKVIVTEMGFDGMYFGMAYVGSPTSLQNIVLHAQLIARAYDAENS